MLAARAPTATQAGPFTISPMLAYGKRGAGGVVDPDTPIFVVDLVGVR